MKDSTINQPYPYSSQTNLLKHIPNSSSQSCELNHRKSGTSASKQIFQLLLAGEKESNMRNKNEEGNRYKQKYEGDGQIEKRPIKQDIYNKKLNSYQTSFECQLCNTEYKDPQMIHLSGKCQHKFCHRCSIQYIKQHFNKNTKIKCPIKQCKALVDNTQIILKELKDNELDQFYTILSMSQNDNENQIEEYTIDEQERKVEDNSSNNEQIDHNNHHNKKNDGFQLNNYRKSMQQEHNSVLHKLPKLIGNSQEIQMVETDSIQKQSTRKKQNELIEVEQKNSSMNKKLTVQSEILESSTKITKKNGLDCQINNNNFENKTYVFFSEAASLTKQEVQPPTLPSKLFKQFCTQVWSNKWSNFFKLLPISIIILAIFAIVIILWLIWVMLYFVSIWCLLIPAIWAIHQIWGCFSRSIKNQVFRNIAFVICLICFPLMFVFFYLLSLCIIIYYSFYLIDMKYLIQGNVSLILSCRKIYLNEIYMFNNQCRCYIHQQCLFCQNKNSILWLVI